MVNSKNTTFILIQNKFVIGEEDSGLLLSPISLTLYTHTTAPLLIRLTLLNRTLWQIQFAHTFFIILSLLYLSFHCNHFLCLNIPSLHYSVISSFTHDSNIYHLQSRADAAEETVKALSEIMKEKDKEINMANVRENRGKRKYDI